MRRIVAVLFVVVLVLAALAVLITRGGEITGIIQNGQSVISLILSLLQLLGIALLIGLGVFVIIQYAQYVHPERFIFEGFSNVSKLIEAEELPFDLNILAREELIRQFRTLDSEWSSISDSADSEADVDALLTDSLYLGKSREKIDLRKHVPEEFFGASDVLEELKSVIKSIKDSEGINLIALAEEIVPQEVTPVIKFVEAFAPPHIIRATGHLQWRSDNQDGTGITFEFVDLGTQRNLMVRTLWWKSPEAEANRASNNVQTPAGVSLDDVAADRSNQLLARMNQAPSTREGEFPLATRRYIDLLDPAMRWLALMFWKQKMISNRPLRNLILKNHEKRRQARVLYLFGALYYACAKTNQYQAYKDFFCQLAIEQFRQASIIDPHWGLPYLYLADLYSFKMQREEGKLRQQLLKAAVDLYQKAFLAESAHGDRQTLHRIRIAMALAELSTNEDTYRKQAVKHIEQLMQELDLARLDPRQAGCATLLYNLALWHGYAAVNNKSSIPFASSKQNTRLFVVYCLACSPKEQWDAVRQNEIFQEICGEDALDYLKTILGARQERRPRLEELKGNDFNQAVKDILRDITRQFKDWVKDGVYSISPPSGSWQ